jgi:ABC-type branched-subunit amino acid transport system substrate-binding protein
VLGGAAFSLPPNPARYPHARVFSLQAQLVMVSTGQVVAQRSFTWAKYQAQDSNTLGLQAIYLPASAEDVSLVVPGLAFFDLKLPLLGSDQWDRADLRDKDHLAQLQGAVFTAAYWADSPDEAVKRFEEAFRRTYAAKPGVLAAQAYDAAALMGGELVAGATDRASLRAGLAHVSNFAGVSGRCSFAGGHQDAVKRPAFVAVQDGALVLLKEQ